MTKDIQIDRKMSYDERKKILTISADVKYGGKHKVETVEHHGEESIKMAYKQFKKKKDYCLTEVTAHEKELEKIKTAMKDVFKKGIVLTSEERKIKASLEKVQNSMQYEQLETQRKQAEELIAGSKKDLKDINIGAEELKQKVKNFKLE